MALIRNLSVDQKATYTTTVNVYNDSGAKKDLTGYTPYGQLKKSYAGSGVTEFVATVTDAANGVITIELDSEITAGLNTGRYVYDIVIVQDGTNPWVITRVQEGIVTVNPAVTSV